MTCCEKVHSYALSSCCLTVASRVLSQELCAVTCKNHMPTRKFNFFLGILGLIRAGVGGSRAALASVLWSSIQSTLFKGQ